MDNEKIIIQKNGKTVECDILFTFDSPDTEKSYVGYSDNSFGSNGRKNIYVSSYDPILGLGTLEDITDEKELEMIHDVLIEIDKQSK